MSTEVAEQNHDVVLVQAERRPAMPTIEEISLQERPHSVPSPVKVIAQHACPNLSQALSLARDRCKMAAKDGYNDYHKYKYASADGVIETAKEALAGTGLAIIPQAQKLTSMPIGNGAIYALDRTILLSHSSGEFVPLTLEGWPVIPEKGRPLDKAFAVALTTSLSYLLRDLLQMPRGDDSDMNARNDTATKADTPKPAPAEKENQSDLPALRNDLGGLIRDVAKAKDMEPDYVYQKLRDTIFHKFPNLPTTTSTWERAELVYAINCMKRALDKPTPETAKPREAGIDAEDAKDDGVNEPPIPGQKLPPAFVANLFTMLQECGQTWPGARQRGFEWAGHSFTGDASIAMLTLDEAGKLKAWAERQKAKMTA